MISTIFKVSTVGNRQLSKQENFAMVSALTRTAQEVKTAQIKATDEKFTIRTNWNKQGPLAFKVQGATKQNPVAVIGTAAEFLEKFVREHEGAIVIKLPRGEFIAVPTSNVRRTKRDIIRAMQRPRALRGKRDVVLPLKSGRSMGLFQYQGRKGKRQLVLLYVLTKRAKIKERDAIQGPAEKVVSKRFGVNYGEALQKALATAR